jgi:hypothetical protein
MTLLCNIEVTLRRVRGSRGWTVVVLSMSKQEFSRLDVLLPVQLGRLMHERPARLNVVYKK